MIHLGILTKYINDKKEPSINSLDKGKRDL
jgi:hypothetical protein